MKRVNNVFHKKLYRKKKKTLDVYVCVHILMNYLRKKSMYVCDVYIVIIHMYTIQRYKLMAALRKLNLILIINVAI